MAAAPDTLQPELILTELNRCGQMRNLKNDSNPKKG
jgi:hypothetical protein